MARKHKHEEEEKLERWLVSYADFITLLFAFFTVMYAISQSDKAKYKQVAESISRSFLSSGGIFPLKGSPFTPFDKPPDKGSSVPPSPREMGHYSKNDMEKLGKIKEQIVTLLEKNTGIRGGSQEVEVFPTEMGFKIRLGESLIFKPGSDKLKREKIPFLFEVGKSLARAGLAIQIEGHTDDREPASGGSLQLSASRAHNLVKFFIEASEYPKSKISLSGFGDTAPISDNATPEGRSRNRRVEISVLSGSQSINELPW